ncbi:MAG: ATP-binding cassette domain-containing protein [Treponema sp.]|nr:ATP-binding cassette domain-containing protein [Treponema sp.]
MHIKLEQLKKEYKTADGSITAVDNVSLDITENTVFGIIGKSGAGKSSLVRLISLLETPDSGEVYYDDKRVDNLSKNALILQRRKIGMIFQNFNLFSSRTAAKNVAYPLEICNFPKSEIDKRVAEMLELVGLGDRGDAPVSTLSGGQKQRVAIARALATKPDILFCDEATSALDPQTTRAILKLIRDIQAKMNLTVVMITHQMEVVRDACDMVAVIDNGKIAELGNVAEIFSSPKAAITKEFISHISVSDTGNDKFVRWSKSGGKYILHFVNDDIGKPVLSEIIKKFDIDVNIRAGGIQNLTNKDIGTLIVDFMGDEKVVSKAINYLEENGVSVEEVKNV